MIRSEVCYQGNQAATVGDMRGVTLARPVAGRVLNQSEKTLNTHCCYNLILSVFTERWYF